MDMLSEVLSWGAKIQFITGSSGLAQRFWLCTIIEDLVKRSAEVLYCVLR